MLWFVGQEVVLKYERRVLSRGTLLQVAEGRYVVVEWESGDVEALGWRTVCRHLHPEPCQRLEIA